MNSQNEVIPIFNILTIIFNLSEINYNGEIINYKSIHAFNLSLRSLNDKNNKTRENIISAIINNRVPNDYYIINKWRFMKRSILNYIVNLTNNKPYKKIECKNKAGRKNNYDFLISVCYEDGTDEKFMVELKFNASTIDEIPQFVSPMKPSQYLNSSYEEYYYDNYLPLLSTMSGIEMPSKEEYFKQIHTNKPKCMKKYQDLYYQGCSNSSKFTNNEEAIKFYNECKKLSNESITNFINNSELNSELFTSYLHNSQKHKIYMFYYENVFTLQTVNMDDYQICSVTNNANKFRYECVSKTGKKLNILLRWKNGNGIAFPAFQIS